MGCKCGLTGIHAPAGALWPRCDLKMAPRAMEAALKWGWGDGECLLRNTNACMHRTRTRVCARAFTHTHTHTQTDSCPSLCGHLFSVHQDCRPNPRRIISSMQSLFICNGSHLSPPLSPGLPLNSSFPASKSIIRAVTGIKKKKKTFTFLFFFLIQKLLVPAHKRI